MKINLASWHLVIIERNVFTAVCGWFVQGCLMYLDGKIKELSSTGCNSTTQSWLEGGIIG